MNTDTKMDAILYAAIQSDEKAMILQMAASSTGHDPGYFLEVTWDLYVYVHDVLERQWNDLRDTGNESSPPTMYEARYCGFPLRPSLAGSKRAKLSRSKERRYS